jgi:nucleoside-diphosphate-sugar epimerase
MSNQNIMAKTKILLTGASGTVGREVLRQLHESRQFDITVFDIKTKKSIKTLSSFSKNIKIIYGNIAEKNDIKKACSKKDFVIHLAALIPPLADKKPVLAHNINVKGTKNLIQCLEEDSKGTFLLYASSISVYGDRILSPWIKTEDPLIPSEGDEYAVTKIMAEKAVRASKLNWSIFRLTAIMGIGNHKTSGLMFHMPLSTAMEICSPEDAARAFVKAVEQKTLLNKKTYNLGGGEKCRINYDEFLSQSFDITGLGKLNFPKKTFAEKNFHCGYYADGDELENILHFRNDTLETYFHKLKQSATPLRKIITSILKKSIKRHLLKLSEPYHAFLAQDEKLTQRFFNTI